MEIRFANIGDIPALIALLRQVGQVHQEIRPDIFRPGCQKYTPEELTGLPTRAGLFSWPNRTEPCWATASASSVLTGAVPP